MSTTTLNVTNPAPILFEIRDGIAFITLNRPVRVNALNMEMALALQQSLDECARLKQVRAVYLTGAGRAFCAGQDLVAALESRGGGLDTILTGRYKPLDTK